MDNNKQTDRHNGSSSLRNSVAESVNAPTDLTNTNSYLRQRRQPGHVTEEEVSGSAAATIMTSVSPLICSNCGPSVDAEYD